MIGRLRGNMLELNGSVAVIDVGGVGYEVEVTTSAAALLAGVPAVAEVYTHLIARDDAQALYGFATAAERNLFRSLIKVSGIGPKLALALLSAVAPDQFASAIARGDVAAITRVPGIGKKTASRLVVELRDRVGELSVPVLGDNAPTREAVLALVALGYRENVAARVVGEAAEATGAAAVEDLVRESLKRVAVG